MGTGECDADSARVQLCCVFAAAAVVTPACANLALPCACPAPALRLPCLENQSPCFPIAHQALSLPLPAAPHRGVFRGADVTVHVTAPSSPGLSMYRESQGVPAVPGYPVQAGWGSRSQSTQVPERHGYPRSTQAASICGMRTETLAEDVHGTYKAQSRRTSSRIASRSALQSISPCSSQSVSYWPLPPVRCQEKCRDRKRAGVRALSSEAQPSARQTGFNAVRLPVATHTSC